MQHLRVFLCPLSVANIFLKLLQASLCLSAIQEHQRTNNGHFVNYNTLPESLWETIIPDYFRIHVTSESIARMKNISGVYAKGGIKRTRDKEWGDDLASKQPDLTETQRQAVHKILDPYFHQMEELARNETSHAA